MVIQADGSLIYNTNGRQIILDYITPEILTRRLINAGYGAELSSFIAFNGGLNARTDAILMGKVVGRIRPLLTEDSQ